MTKTPDPTFLTTPECRLRYPALFEKKPRIKDSEKLTYQAVLLFPPHTNWAPFTAAMGAAMIAEFGKTIPREQLSDFPIRRAEDFAKRPDGYLDGWFVISAHNGKYRPAVVDRSNQPVGDPERLYDGLWVRAYLNAWCWTYTSKKGVSFGLNGLQIVRDDEPFSGGGGVIDASAAFEPLGHIDAPATSKTSKTDFDFGI